MSNKLDPKTDSVEPMVYQIRLKGHLSREWTDWFEGLTITLEGSGDTLLTGPVADQSALYGLLRKVRDLGMSLLSVNRVESCPERSRRATPSMPLPFRGPGTDQADASNGLVNIEPKRGDEK